MKQQDQHKGAELEQAQHAVNRSLSTFEGAMDELARAVDDVGDVIQRVMGFASLPREEIKKFSQRAREVVEDVKKNPQPYVLALGTVIAYLGYRSWRHSQEASAPRFSADAGY